MSVVPVGASSSSTPQGTERAKKNTLTQEDFLKLFTTQLKFQNPLEPLDNFQMATQMAQFNTVDALMKMNETMTQLAANQNSMNHLQAAGLIGKKVETQGNRLSLQQGTASEGMYQLSRPGKVMIQVFNGQGSLVRQIDAGVKDGSRQKIGWDGKNQAGATLPDGFYTFRVLATDSQGQALPVTLYQTGKVDGISLEKGSILLQVNGEQVSFGDILAILN
jgi:flagellar basal-body rod modification protein FlgD